jgi:glycosyltransferase involved in cell wall biosynthesis
MNNTQSNNIAKSQSNPKVVVCVPAYNEANNISDIVHRARNYSDEVVVCNDGSTDNTAKLAKQAGAIVVSHQKNGGYGKSIRTLFQKALELQADIVVTIDSDGQHNPEQIPDIIEPILNSGYDIVIGSRFIDENDKKKVPLYRSIGIRTITKFTNQASYKNLTDAQSGFRGYARHTIEQINLIEDGMRISTEILLRAARKKFTVKEVPITINYDVEHSSTHNFLSHGIGVLFSVIHFISLRHPLIFYGLPGISLLLLAGYFAYNSLELFSTTRYISINMILLSITTTIIGIILLTTGGILFTIAVMLAKETKSSQFFTVIQFICLRHPIVFFGLPGVGLLIFSGYFAYSALDYFSSWRYVTAELTNRLFVTVGTAIIGIVLLSSGSMLYSIASMLKGKIRTDF